MIPGSISWVSRGTPGKLEYPNRRCRSTHGDSPILRRIPKPIIIAPSRRVACPAVPVELRPLFTQTIGSRAATILVVTRADCGKDPPPLGKTRIWAGPRISAFAPAVQPPHPSSEAALEADFLLWPEFVCTSWWSDIWSDAPNPFDTIGIPQEILGDVLRAKMNNDYAFHAR